MINSYKLSGHIIGVTFKIVATLFVSQCVFLFFEEAVIPAIGILVIMAFMTFAYKELMHYFIVSETVEDTIINRKTVAANILEKIRSDKNGSYSWVTKAKIANLESIAGNIILERDNPINKGKRFSPFCYWFNKRNHLLTLGIIAVLTSTIGCSSVNDDKKQNENNLAAHMGRESSGAHSTKYESALLVPGRIFKCLLSAPYEKGKYISAVIVDDVCHDDDIVFPSGTKISGAVSKIEGNTVYVDCWRVYLLKTLSLKGSLLRITKDANAFCTGVEGIDLDGNGTIPVGTNFLISTREPVYELDFAIETPLPLNFLIPCALTAEARKNGDIEGVVSENVYWGGELILKGVSTRIKGKCEDFNSGRLLSFDKWIALRDDGSAIELKGVALERSNDIGNGTLGIVAKEDGSVPKEHPFYLMTIK